MVASACHTATDGAGRQRRQGRWRVRLAKPPIDFVGIDIGRSLVLTVSEAVGREAIAVTRRSDVMVAT